ncbi:MAG TPA: YdiU family protein [Polyangiales bacterium]|nr:YdiU family protein [Polyangiales bacterium]
MSNPAAALEGLRFDNSFVRTLPGDPDRSPRRRQVLGACYSEIAPTPVSSPQLLAYAREVAELLDLPQELWQGSELVQVLAGNRVLPGMQPYAACYGGHQFGNWAGQLGDGRAITLGERINARGERWELQLKGAGPTPYSRTADGRAVLRSSLREFLCSEAMHHLGVPTTRALSLVTTGEPVMRDMFYDGRPAYEPGAVVCRVAPSFLRFGNFEILAARNDQQTLRALADYTLQTLYPELGPGAYLRWLEEVCRRTVTMIVHWMRVGFVHGVMNTDNMSVLGLTIDYGPYGWLEDYDPSWTPNTTDAHGRRYRFGHQPNVAIWNLSRFASALLPLLGAPEPVQELLEQAAEDLEAQLETMQREKLGLAPGRDASSLVPELPELLYLGQLDYTLFHRWLGELPSAGEPDVSGLLAATSYAADSRGEEEREKLGRWLRRYAQACVAAGLPDAERRQRMHAVNPKYVLRNYMAQLAIDKAEQGDASLIRELLELLRKPYADQPEQGQWAARRPEWARQRAGCSMLSCSS